MNDLLAVVTAAEAAARWHGTQRHKGIPDKPFVNHLLEVARLVAEATRGEDADLITAAILHDAMEDQDVPRTLIAQGFGEAVAAVIEEVTDDPALDDEARKRAQVEHAASLSVRAKLIKPRAPRHPRAFQDFDPREGQPAPAPEPLPEIRQWV